MSNTAKGMWEVDPQTKSKLSAVQKTNENDRCCDCGAPSPQWASPKFSTFICLTCAGIHRGLGVHISFVRSITMDAFKTGEILRMEQGGNKPWRDFFDNHELNKAEGRAFEDCTIQERYGGDVGEEWKEFLSAKVEGREVQPIERKGSAIGVAAGAGSGRATPVGGAGAKKSALGSRGTGAPSGAAPTQKEQNEAYFAKLGNANATRRDDLPPSQGGKFTGFGSAPPPQASSSAGGVPGIDDFQKDPVAALTKGFGWFTSTVAKQAKQVNDTYVQPAAQQIATSDLAAQARIHASQLGTGLQSSARTATDQFNRFVEGDEYVASKRQTEPERKDFWDSFAAAGEERAAAKKQSGSGAIGTSAMKSGDAASSASAAGKKKEDWGEDW